MGKTSTEVKERWKAKAYKRYIVYLRNDSDHHLIEYVEKNKERIGTTNIFRDALDEYAKGER